MSNLVTEEDDVEQNPSCKEENKPRTATTMFLYLRELFFLFALVITSYAALFNRYLIFLKKKTAVKRVVD